MQKKIDAAAVRPGDDAGGLPAGGVAWPTPRPSTGSRMAGRPTRSGPTSSPAPSNGRRTPATPSTPRSTTATCLAAGGGARRDRRQGRRHRHHQPRSGQPGRGRQGSQRRQIPIINFNTPDPKAELRRLCRRRQRHVRQALGAVSGRQGPGEVGRLRLDAGRSPGRHLWRAGRRRHQAACSSRSASPGKSPKPRSTRPRSSTAWSTTSPPTAPRSRRSSASATW